MPRKLGATSRLAQHHWLERFKIADDQAAQECQREWESSYLDWSWARLSFSFSLASMTWKKYHPSCWEAFPPATQPYHTQTEHTFLQNWNLCTCSLLTKAQTLLDCEEIETLAPGMDLPSQDADQDGLLFHVCAESEFLDHAKFLELSLQLPSCPLRLSPDSQLLMSSLETYQVHDSQDLVQHGLHNPQQAEHWLHILGLHFQEEGPLIVYQCVNLGRSHNWEVLVSLTQIYFQICWVVESELHHLGGCLWAAMKPLFAWTWDSHSRCLLLLSERCSKLDPWSSCCYCSLEI